MKWLVIAIVIAAFLYPNHITETELPKWCFYAEYKSLKIYEQTNRPEHAFVELTNGRAKVYVPCPL